MKKISPLRLGAISAATITLYTRLRDRSRRSSALPRAAGRLSFELAMAGLVLAAAPASEALAAVTIGQQITGMEKAENSIQTSSGRIFVSYDGGIFELTQSAGTWTKTPVTKLMPSGSSGHCYFLGMAEYANTLYTVCTEDNASAAARKHLMAMRLEVANDVLLQVIELTGVELPNGLASDGQGNLFFANTTLPDLTKNPAVKPGTLHRIQLTGRKTVAGPNTQVYPSIGTTPTAALALLNPNGVKFDSGKLYVTANPPALSGTSILARFPVSSAGTLGTPVTLYSSTTFLDDFALVKGGMLIIEWIGGSLKYINEAGGVLRTYSVPFSFPTSATMLKPGTSPGAAVLVTLQGSDRAVFLETDWPIAPR
ncbi:MAG: hypothetical protein RLZZ618_232 [Pseudomonadota bacterium]|jgi:sugar lactone lactonase YvrE